MNLHNPLRKQYNFEFRFRVLTQITNHINETFEKQKQTIIDDIALQHRDVTNTKAGFRYHGKTYFHRLLEFSYAYTRLHPSLHKTFDTHLTNWDKHQERELVVKNTVTNALNLMGNINDLYSLLPDCIHSVLPPQDGDEPTLSTQHFDQFKAENEHGLKTLKVQLVMKTMKQ